MKASDGALIEVALRLARFDIAAKVVSSPAGYAEWRKLVDAYVRRLRRVM